MDHPVVQEICNLLDVAGVPYTLLEHKEAISSKDAAEVREGFSLAEGGKALLVQADDTFVQIVVPGDKKFSNKKVRKLLQSENVRLASLDAVERITKGILPGAIPPFGNLFNIPVYADVHIADNERLVFNCGMRTKSIAMKVKDYLAVVQPTVADIAE